MKPLLHIHANAYRISGSAADRLLAEGFVDTMFLEPITEYDSFCPDRHFSKKIEGRQGFRSSVDSCVEVLRADPRFVGFVETEVVQRVARLLPEQSTPLAPLSATTTFRVWERWRESEIHVSVREGSQSEDFVGLMQSLGFLSVRFAKETGITRVYSVQGQRRSVDAMYKALAKHLLSHGLPFECKLSLERSASHWISPGFCLFPNQLENFEY